ncbi:MAG: hypothetical protein PVI26_08060 [Chitinispirillia bacterium]|jgi:hypothetical protein
MINLLTETTEKMTVLKGNVIALNQEGSIEVTGKNGKSKNCFITTLHKSKLPEISVGDTVIYSMDGNSEYGFILGIVCRYMPVKQETTTVKPDKKPSEVNVDGQRLVFEAQKEIMLKCGKGSIVLKRDGKIVIKGINVITRARNTNKIKGGSVSIN